MLLASSMGICNGGQSTVHSSLTCYTCMKLWEHSMYNWSYKWFFWMSQQSSIWDSVFFLFFRENVLIFHVNDSHEMSRLISFKNKKKKIKMLSAAVVIGAFRMTVNFYVNSSIWHHFLFTIRPAVLDLAYTSSFSWIQILLYHFMTFAVWFSSCLPFV